MQPTAAMAQETYYVPGVERPFRMLEYALPALCRHTPFRMDSSLGGPAILSYQLCAQASITHAPHAKMQGHEAVNSIYHC